MLHAFWDKFTNRCRKTLCLANEHADKRKVRLVNSMFLLWGLLDEGGNLAVQILADLQVDPKLLKLQVEACLPLGTYLSHEEAIPYDESARKALVAAIDLGYRQKAIGCHHLLAGIMAGVETEAAFLLGKANVTLELIYAEMSALTG